MNIHASLMPSGEDDDEPASIRVRALFLSDPHLGTRGCQAEKLLDFLRLYEADLIYLVGDIVDGWQLKLGWYWPQAHDDVVQKLLRMSRDGVSVIGTIVFVVAVQEPEDDSLASPRRRDGSHRTVPRVH
jgi:hypothetical protein